MGLSDILFGLKLALNQIDIVPAAQGLGRS